MLPNDQLEKLGFRHNVIDSYWFYDKPVLTMSEGYPVGFIIRIKEDTIETLVLDELFGQPYYYMGSGHENCETIKTRIDNIIATMQQAGLPIEHSHEEYRLTRNK